jgi:hypothetical protein
MKLLICFSALMSQAFSTVIAKLEEQHKQTIGSIDMMRENFIPVPEAMTQISDRITTVISLVSELSRDSAEIKKISDGMAELCAKNKGWLLLRSVRIMD